MVDITNNKIKDFSDQPADFDVLISKLQCFFKLLQFHSNNIFSITDSYIQAIDKITDASDSYYVHQYSSVFESCSLYKNLVVNVKILISNDLAMFYSNNNSIAEIADKYKHDLVMQVACDHHHATAKAHQISKYIQLSTEYNFLMARWRRELIEFSEICFE